MSKISNLCEYVYGSDWQQELAREFDVGLETVRYWTKLGRAPQHVEDRLHRMAVEREETFGSILDDLSGAQ